VPDVVTDNAADIDRALMARVAARDADALGTLYDRYGRMVFGVLRALLPSPEAAEEVIQDSFHSLWRSAGRYSEARGSVRTWLLAIARNAAIDWQRTKGRRVAHERPLDVVTGVRDTLADELIERVTLRSQVRDALAALPREQREVVVLAYYGGLTQTEIALRTGAPIGTVKGRARLAMDRLRRSLAEESR
jgi:RNA polymerase sigma-70 factor (ECF subfamily)